MTEWIVGGVASTALLTFCGWSLYWRGYRSGAKYVLEDWKKYMNPYMKDTEE